MKKQYVFIIMILLIFYFSIAILRHLYKEYQINSDIEYIRKITNDVEKRIEEAKKIIEYKTSKAYKNKVLKEQQSFKNKGEVVVYLTTEENFNKYTTLTEAKKENKIETKDNIEIDIKNLTIYEKWMYFLFKKSPEIR